MLKYVVKERVFGFDKSITPKFVLDGLIDTLNINSNKGISVQLGSFGCFRSGLNCKSQDKKEDVDSKCIERLKIIFTLGSKFKAMLSKVSVERLDMKSIFKDDHDEDNIPDPLS